MNPDSPAIVHRIRQLLDLQTQTTISALHAPSASELWRDYAARERELRRLFEELENNIRDSENKGLNLPA